MRSMKPSIHSLKLITDRPTSSYTAAFGFIALLALTLTACQRETGPETLASETHVQPVRVATVEYESTAVAQRLPGVTRAVERADLAFLHDGHLAARLVRRGEQVNTGDALAILHNPALMPGVTSAEARVREIDRQLEQLERETQRLENLHERGLVATDDLDRTRSRRDALMESRQVAESALAEAREQLAEGTLRAPFAGQVVELHIEPGQYVAPGQPILSLVAPDRLEVAVSLPARLAQQLRVGQTAGLGQVDEAAFVVGQITEIGPASPGRPSRVIISLPTEPGPAWQPGRAVQVELELAGNQSLTVPMAAVIRPATGSSRVYRVRNGVAERIDVTPGRLHNGRVTVNGELAAGDKIVIAGHGRLLHGDAVRVLQ
jgi:RND family efflux transporter MFP subunit